MPKFKYEIDPRSFGDTPKTWALSFLQLGTFDFSFGTSPNWHINACLLPTPPPCPPAPSNIEWNGKEKYGQVHSFLIRLKYAFSLINLMTKAAFLYHFGENVSKIWFFVWNSDTFVFIQKSVHFFTFLKTYVPKILTSDKFGFQASGFQANNEN